VAHRGLFWLKQSIEAAMKSTTVLLVMFSFAAGLGTGLSGPLAKAGAGLANMVWHEPASSRADRITASFEATRAVFQPADFRWTAQQAKSSAALCAPKDDAKAADFAGVQHL
jgi:hypothetical protein